MLLGKIIKYALKVSLGVLSITNLASCRIDNSKNINKRQLELLVTRWIKDQEKDECISIPTEIQDLILDFSLEDIFRDVDLISALYRLKGHTNSVYSLAISLDDEYLLSGSKDKTIRVWSSKSRETKWILKGHYSHVTALSIEKHNEYVVSGGQDSNVKKWKLKTNGSYISTKLPSHGNCVNSIVISPDQNYIVSASDDKCVKITKREDNLYFKGFNEPNVLKGTHRLKSVAISNNNEYLVAGSEDGTIRVWSNWNKVEDITLHDIIGHSDSVNCVLISNDGKFIYSGSNDHIIGICDIEKRRLIDTLVGHARSVNSISLSTDGRYLVSGSDDMTIKIWDLINKKCIKTLRHNEKIYSVIISHGNKYIYSAGKTIKVWGWKYK